MFTRSSSVKREKSAAEIDPEAASVAAAPPTPNARQTAATTGPSAMTGRRRPVVFLSPRRAASFFISFFISWASVTTGSETLDRCAHLTFARGALCALAYIKHRRSKQHEQQRVARRHWNQSWSEAGKDRKFQSPSGQSNQAKNCGQRAAHCGDHV